ncbi:MAG: amidohydrolase family protein [Bacteriovoracaceae bacterium]|nr:amidohydrolase family protein [Bacteriovoracaceae bacterium]
MKYVLANIKKLYDGKSNHEDSVHRDVDVVIDKGQIDQLILDPSKKKYSKDFQIVDCKNLFVTPGLVDCHSHITIVGLESEDVIRTNSPAGLLYCEKILYQTLVYGGVTSIREIGGATNFIKRMVDEGVMIGPRMKIAIAILSTTGGHLDFCGPDRCHGDISPLFKAGPGRPSSLVDGPWECRKRVRELKACGADFVKLCTSPGVASPNDELEHEDLSREEIDAICDEAAKRGMKVAAHAHSKHGIKMAIEGGVRDIQHISYMDDELASLAHKRGCVVTPTSWVIDEFSQISKLPSAVRDKIDQVGEHHANAVRAAHQNGLKILAGTDAFLPGMHGRNYLELGSLHNKGVDALSVWHGATGLAADEIGLSQTGQISAGHTADLLVLKNDVIDNPNKFESDSILEVFKDGLSHKNYFEGLPKNDFDTINRHFLAMEKAETFGVKLPR